MQAVVKNLLEPEWEAVFEENSYGFRPGRSCQDAIAQAFILLKAGKGTRNTWILDADISGFFDNISHKYIEETIGNTPGIKLIKMWLKAGYLDKGTFNETERGTPQGSVISPLLANIGLHGLEARIKEIDYRTPPNKKYPNMGRKIEYGMGIIRYADDFIVTAYSEKYIQKAKQVIEVWLKERNLSFSEEKTRVTHIEDGFDFLGFNVRSYQEKLLIKPSKAKVLAFCKRIGQVVKSMNGASQITVISKLNPILRGFANYYKGVVSKEVFGYIGHRVWEYLWRWAKRRHPNKSKKWIKNKYFPRIGRRAWVFTCEGKDRRGNEKWATLFDIASVQIVRHEKVKGKASPDNPELQEYWKKRQDKQGMTRWANGSKYQNIANNQNHKCPTCNESLYNGEELEVHHIVTVQEGGTDDQWNLVHMHTPCHKQQHPKSKIRARSKA
jgi:RNA-directed DNA polymerase